MPRPSRVPLRIAVALLVIAAFLAFAWWHSASSRQEHDADLAVIRAFAARVGPALKAPVRRPPLEGPADPGDAAVAYRLAVAHAAGDADGEALRLLREKGEPPADLPALVARWQKSLEALRRAASCDEFQPPDLDEDLPIEELLDLGSASMAAGLAALAADDAATAVDHWLAAATLVRDLARGPTLIREMLGITQLELIADRWWSPEALAALPDAQLRRLAAALARLDADCAPAVQTFAAELWFMAGSVDGARSDGLIGAFMAAPLVPALRARIDACERLQALGERDWPAYSALFAELDARARGGNRGERLFAGRWQLAARDRRTAITRLRLLRLAVAFQLDEPLPELPDPFAGAMLRATATGTGMKFASVGDGAPIERRATTR